MNVFLFFLAVGLSAGLFFYFIEWKVHKEMTQEHSAAWDYGSWAEFVRQLQRHEWRYDPHFGSIFHPEPLGTSQVHASVVQFNNCGMVIPFLQFWRLLIFTRSIKKQRVVRAVGAWNGVPQLHLSRTTNRRNMEVLVSFDEQGRVKS